MKKLLLILLTAIPWLATAQAPVSVAERPLYDKKSIGEIRGAGVSPGRAEGESQSIKTASANETCLAKPRPTRRAEAPQLHHK